MTDTADSAVEPPFAPTTPLGTRLRDLAEQVDEALYAENGRGGEARNVLHALYMDVVVGRPHSLAEVEDPISGWGLPLLQARARAVLGVVAALGQRVNEEREAKEAALRQLAASTARERELEAQVARLSNGAKPEDDGKDPVEELLREGVDGFLRMLGKMG